MKSRALLEKSAEEHNLLSLLKKGAGGGLKRLGNKKFRRPPEKPKTRKELRKEKRKEKKSQKHNYILKRFGKSLEKEGEGQGKKKRKRNRKRKRKQDGGDSSASSAPNNPDSAKSPMSKDPKNKDVSSHVRSERDAIDKEMEELQKEMAEGRKKRLLEENEDEDKYIRKMEKKLKLNKKAKVPASFKVDGLDYLLDLCHTLDKKKEKESDKIVVRDRKTTKASVKEEDEDEDDSDSNLEDSEEDEEMDSEEEVAGEDGAASDIEEEEDDEDMDSDEDDENSDLEDADSSAEVDDEDNDGPSDSEGNEDSESDNVNEKSVSDDSSPKKKKKKKKSKEEEGIWEDIYGRMRRKDGSIVEAGHEKSEGQNKPAEDSKQSAVPVGKYVPPSQRKNQTPREKISRSLKGLLNRLSEANMSSIAKQVEELYMTNSRNEMNECLLDLIYAALLRNVLVPERVVLEHMMLITILHANVGPEVGAFFLQRFVQDFKAKYDDKSLDEDSKELDNLVLLISGLYHFKVVDCCLLYDLLKSLATSFGPKDVELILTGLRSVGFRLRKDDPVELKALILLIQQKASDQKSSTSSAKVKFMLEVVTAIRNNNMTKIPNYDPSTGEHLLKILKVYFHKGNYVSSMKIKMDDLLNAATKGRWWIVGSAWSNIDSERPSKSDLPVTANKEENEKLLAKARELGMNTETRKTIFCILMTAEDYVDAFEKLTQLDLKNNQEREIIHVATYCCFHEKKFNPYYALIVSKFCATNRKYMLTLQYTLWDRLKDLNSLKSYQSSNLAKLLVHLINDKSLPLSSLKVIEYAEMDKAKLKFLKEVLYGLLLQGEEDDVREIFLKSAASENLHMFRESLRLFMGHFLVQPNVITSDGENVGCELSEDELELLKDRIKIAEAAMSLGRSRVSL